MVLYVQEVLELFYSEIGQLILGLHRILIWPDIRQIFLPDIRLNSNIEFFSERMYKSAHRYIDIILFVKTIFDFKHFFGYPVIRPTEHPANKTGYPAGYRI